MNKEKKSVLKFTLVRKVKPPKRGTGKSAGIDLFIPEFDERFLKDFYEKNPQICQVREDEYEYIHTDDSIFLAPGAQLIIPSGVKIVGNPNTMYPLLNKSGVATRKRLNRTAELIDEDYGGEIHIAIQNTSHFIVRIKSGEKLIQMTETTCTYSELEQLTNTEYVEEFGKMESARGEGGFGHTGTE